MHHPIGALAAAVLAAAIGRQRPPRLPPFAAPSRPGSSLMVPPTPSCRPMLSLTPGSRQRAPAARTRCAAACYGAPAYAPPPRPPLKPTAPRRRPRAGHLRPKIWGEVCSCQHPGGCHPGRPAELGGGAQGKRAGRLHTAVAVAARRRRWLLLRCWQAVQRAGLRTLCTAARADSAGFSSWQPEGWSVQSQPGRAHARPWPWRQQSALRCATLQASKPRRPHQKMESVVKVGAAHQGSALGGTWKRHELLFGQQHVPVGRLTGSWVRASFPRAPRAWTRGAAACSTPLAPPASCRPAGDGPAAGHHRRRGAPALLGLAGQARPHLCAGRH